MPPDNEIFRDTSLRGIRVVECGREVSAPLCARVLADLGAEVIKVEPPGGDAMRHHGPFAPGNGDRGARGDLSAMFAYLNAGKRSVRSTGDPVADREALGRLAMGADVVVTNLPSAERRQWGLDLAGLRAQCPRLVTVSLSPYGALGPDADTPAHEINVCAVGGISIILGQHGRTPLSFPFAVPAQQAGLHGAAAALTALFARRRCGSGQAVDIAEADVLAFYSGGMALFLVGAGGTWQRRGFDRHGGIYPSGFYPCKDGHIFLATQTRAQWKGFLGLMGDPEWARQDPKLQDGMAIGWEHANEVDLHFIPWLLQFTRRELTDMAREANLVLGPIYEAGELLDDPHLEARHFWREVDLGGTAVRLPGMGYTLSATPAHFGAVPRLGEHSELAETGFDRVEMADGDDRRRDETSRVVQEDGVASRRLPRPLSGYRAIDFGWNWAGPLVGQILADMGMEVIKVETRRRLDFMRHWAHARQFFHNANRGKRSVSIDIKKEGGVELVRRLAARSDLVVDNFAAGVMERNGLGYEDFRAVNPGIIVLSMAMAGQTGPLRHLRGFATTATGFAGLEAAIGYPGGESTGLPMIGLGDANAAIQGVVACLAALWHRERTGEGQFIDLSQIEAAAALMFEPMIGAQLGTMRPGPQGNDHPAMAPHGIYPTAGEDRWISLAVDSDEAWLALCRVMGDPPWAVDPVLRSGVERHRRRAEIDDHLASWTGRAERDRLLERLREAGLAAAPVLEIEEMQAWPQLVSRGLSEEVQSFEGKAGTVYNTPWHLDLTPRAVTGPSPKAGEHNEQVFRDLLGMSEAEMEALVERKVLW